MAVNGTPYTSLLDTGASTNAVPEELVLNIINAAFEKGMNPGSKDWPVALECWSGGERVTGVAKGHDLEIIGAALIPITFTGVVGRAKTKRLRFKVFGKGCSSWMGFIIGGPTLEPEPLGLGLRSGPNGHYLEALGLLCARGEAREVADRMEACFLMDQANPGCLGKPMFPEGAWGNPKNGHFTEELLASSSG